MDNTLAAGLIQGVATLVSAVCAVVLALWLVRRHELSRARVDCVRRIFAYRFVLVDGVEAHEAPIQQFLAALNEVPFLFAKHPEALAKYRDLRDQGVSDNRIVVLLRALAPHVAVDFRPLGDGDITRILIISRKAARK